MNVNLTPRFVLVPGPYDPGFGNVLPFPSLVDGYVKGFREKVPNSEFVTNPCRIDYKDKSILISRLDMLHKMRRNLIIDLESSTEIYKHVNSNSINNSMFKQLALINI